MKKLMITVLGLCLYLTGFAQTVNIVFRGNQRTDYRVVIDGMGYYASDAGTSVNNNVYRTTNSSGQRTMALSNLLPGTHKIEIYSNANSLRNTSGQRVYTNNFKLRKNYDMTITVNGRRISFSEKLNPMSNANGQYRTAMTSAGFNNLLQRVRQNRYQDGRVTTIRSALKSTDYFTNDQLSQLLALASTQSDRLDLAKTAYSVSTDPTNYYNDLYRLFDGQSYRNSLSAYIRSQPAENETPVATGRTLLSTTAYNQLLYDLNNNNYQSGKYSIINNAFSNRSNAFTTAQVRQLLGAISSEPDRLYLAKQAYPAVSDAGAYASLLTLFPSQSSRQELNSFIINSGGIGNQSLVITRTPMSTSDFNTLYRQAGNHLRGSSRYTELKTAFNDPQNYFTSSQLKQLLSLVAPGNSLLAISESSRIELAKLSYARVTDPVNFSQVIDLFSTQSSRDELNSYIRYQVNQ